MKHSVMFCFFGLVFIGFVCWSYAHPVAEAPEPLRLSVAQCIERALVAHPGIRAAAFGRDVADARLHQALSQRILPKLQLTSVNSIAPGVRAANGDLLSLDTRNDYTNLGPFTRWELQFVQPLFTFGRVSHAVRAALEGVEAEAQGIRREKDTVVTQVYQLYYGYVLAREFQRVAKEASDAVNKALDKLQEFLEDPEADVTDADRYRLELFQFEVKNRMSEIELKKKLALSTLKALIGLRADRAFEPKDRFLKPLPVHIKSLAYYLDEGRHRRPEIAQLDAAVAAREALVKIERANFYPVIFLAGNAVISRAPVRPDIRNPFLKDVFNERFVGVGLGLTMSLNFGMIRARVREAEYKLEQLKARRDEALMGIQQEIVKAYEEAHAAQIQMDNARKAFRTARQWMTEEQLTFDLEGSNTKELIDALRAYLTLKAAYYERIYQFNTAVVELHRVVGFPTGYLLARSSVSTEPSGRAATAALVDASERRSVDMAFSTVSRPRSVTSGVLRSPNMSPLVFFKEANRSVHRKVKRDEARGNDRW